MNRIIGIILILVGGVLIYEGVSRKNSVVGAASEVGTNVANAVDGKGRIPEHVYYIIAGGVAAAAGIGMTLSGGRKG